MNNIQLTGHDAPIPIDSIVWLEGDANYTRVHTQENAVMVVTQPLFWFEQHLNFIRVHRSAIVNPMYVQEFVHKKGRSGWIRLLDNKIIQVSRARLERTASQLKLTGAQELAFIVS